MELKDTFNRSHDYLRISLTERCNLRCTYCMPEEGVALSPKPKIMNVDEILGISKVFVDQGIKKIRLTGGEPLVKRGIDRILKGLSSYDIELSITTNAVILDQHLDILKSTGVRNLNISIDTLQKEKFRIITRRDHYSRVMNVIQKVQADPFFNVKLNAVLIKGFNDDEIVDFIELTRDMNIGMRFIEFMPFNGNQWEVDKLVSDQKVLETLQAYYGPSVIQRLQDKQNDTSRNYRIGDYKGSFALISTVTNPFCDSCNRIRLMANGKIKNCLFSPGETDILGPYREGKDIVPIIQSSLLKKHQSRGGLSADSDFINPDKHNNRSMIMIGG